MKFLPLFHQSALTHPQEHDNFAGALTQHLQCNTNEIVTNVPDEETPAMPSLNPWLIAPQAPGHAWLRELICSAQGTKAGKVLLLSMAQ